MKSNSFFNQIFLFFFEKFQGGNSEVVGNIEAQKKIRITNEREILKEKPLSLVDNQINKNIIASVKNKEKISPKKRKQQTSKENERKIVTPKRKQVPSVKKVINDQKNTQHISPRKTKIITRALYDDEDTPSKKRKRSTEQKNSSSPSNKKSNQTRKTQMIPSIFSPLKNQAGSKDKIVLIIDVREINNKTNKGKKTTKKKIFLTNQKKKSEKKKIKVKE